MFPLVHYAVNQRLYGSVSPLMAIGGLWPDMAIGANVRREAGHTKCKEFYAWCRENAPEYMDLAIGALTHSTEPGCVDYYADEQLPQLDEALMPHPDITRMPVRYMQNKYIHEYPKGWCFAMGEHYLSQVSASTQLPDNMIWWKSHNFIEMGYELLTDEADPTIKQKLLELGENSAAIAEAADVLGEFYNASPNRIKIIYTRIPILFALRKTDPLTLAHKQRRLFMMRFNRGDADEQAMAALLEQIREDLRPGYHILMDYLTEQAGATVKRVDADCTAGNIATSLNGMIYDSSQLNTSII